MGWAAVAQVKAGVSRDLRVLDEAETHARAVSAAAPQSPHGYAVLGYVEFERGRHEEAVANFRRALGYEPNEPDVLMYLGLSYVYTGQCDRAGEVSRQLMACDPLAGISWMLTGVVEWFRGRFDAAIAPIRRGVDLDPDNFIIHWCLAYNYALTGQLREAGEQVAWLEQAGPAVPYTLQMRALLDALGGQHSRAIETLDAVDSVPLDQHLLFHLAESYAVAGAGDRALALLARSVNEGFYPYEFIAEHAPFLASLRELPQYAPIAADARRRADAFRQWDRTSIA
jgi:Flp pilus assembly protein TadD